jgi:hypothetical protein
MSESFDELTRAIAAGTSRRKALRRFIGGVAAAFLAILPGFSAPKAASADPIRVPVPPGVNGFTAKFPGKGLGVNGTFPGKGLGVNGTFPGQGKGVIVVNGTSPK